jgi:hypothetical protein
MPSLLPQILSWGRLLLAGCWSLDVACVMPVLRLCRSYRGQATFGETAVGGILSSSPGSGSPRWSCQPADGAASPLGRAGLLDLAPWRFLGCQPADSTALGIPQKSSPRQEVLCGKTKYPADFLVLDSAASKTCPIIFGRPFLNTCGTVIDCKKEKILTKFDG